MAFATASPIRMNWMGGNRKAIPQGAGLLASESNYFIGGDQKNWVTGVPNYARSSTAMSTPGIDLVFYGSNRELEYDFVVQPGADPALIRLRFNGSSRVSLDSNGDLLVETDAENVRHHKPRLYQDRNGRRTELTGSFEVGPRGTVRFQVPRYDSSVPLIIDPVITYNKLPRRERRGLH
jgi:hypothetical protein